MSAGKSLKEQNAWLIRAALLIHVLAFVYVAFAFARVAEPDFLQKAHGFLAPGSISLGLIALARLALLGLIPAHLRDRLVHWRWHYPLPGARAFTKFGPGDPRVNMENLKKSFKQLPSALDEQ